MAAALDGNENIMNYKNNKVINRIREIRLPLNGRIVASKLVFPNWFLHFNDLSTHRSFCK